MNDREARTLLHGIRAPDEHGAAERAWAVARQSYADREPVPRTRRAPLKAIAAIAVVGAIAGIAVSPAGSWIRDAIGRERVVGVETARPTLTSLPAPGRLLVVSHSGTWVVRQDGSRRLLGVYHGASWSPRGLFVIAWRGSELTALEPGKTESVRWSLSRGQVADARWAPSGFRVAYRSARSLRVVAGDGSGDRRLAARVGAVAPAWRPGERNVLAYVRADGRVVVQDVDSGEVLWRTPALADVVALAWASGGGLVVASPDAIQTFRDGRELRGSRIAVDAGRVTSLAIAPGSDTVTYAVANHATREGRVLSAARDGRPPRLLFAGQGSFSSLVHSPDGRYVLIGWPAADQWLFVPLAGKRLVATANVARIFAPDQALAASFPRAEGWTVAAG